MALTTDKIATFCNDLEESLKQEIEKYNQIRNALLQQEVYLRILDDRLKNYRDLLLIAQNEAEQEKKETFPLYEPLNYPSLKNEVIYDTNGDVLAQSKNVGLE